MEKKPSSYVERYRREHLRAILKHAERCLVAAGKSRDAWRHLSVEVNEKGREPFFFFHGDPVAGIAALGPSREWLGRFDGRTISRIAKAVRKRAVPPPRPAGWPAHMPLAPDEDAARTALFLERPDEAEAYHKATSEGLHLTDAWCAAQTAALANLALQQNNAADMKRVDPAVWRYDRMLGGDARLRRELVRVRSKGGKVSGKKRAKNKPALPRQRNEQMIVDYEGAVVSDHMKPAEAIRYVANRYDLTSPQVRRIIQPHVRWPRLRAVLESAS